MSTSVAPILTFGAEAGSRKICRYSPFTRTSTVVMQSSRISRTTTSHLRSTFGRVSRPLHASACRHDFVAPPHPVSHMRPILYDDPPSQSPGQYLRHPYSLSEFKQEVIDTKNDLEFEYKVRRQQLDTFHQTFWLDVSY